MFSIAPEDFVITASSLRSRTSSNVSLRALKTKQAMAYLKMAQLKKKHKLLRQEEEMKLERQIIDTQFEIEQGDLQVQLLESEQNPVLNQPPFVPENFRPCAEESNFVSHPKVFEEEQDEWRPRPFHPKPSTLNPYEKELIFYGEPPVKVEKDHSLPIDTLDRMALNIKQGFALPKPQLQTFDGNPLEYWNFMKSFEASIEQNAASENEKLMYLL